MTISELIKQLELIKAHNGDIKVLCIYDYINYDFYTPELLVEKHKDGKNYLMLNSNM